MPVIDSDGDVPADDGGAGAAHRFDDSTQRNGLVMMCHKPIELLLEHSSRYGSGPSLRRVEPMIDEDGNVLLRDRGQTIQEDKPGQ